MTKEKAGVYYSFHHPALSSIGTKVTIIIDSDNVLWIDRNWPTEESIGIPMQELEDLIVEYKKAFPRRGK